MREPGSASHPISALYAAPDFIEAAVRAGKREKAYPALESLRSWAREAANPWAEAMVARCRGLLAVEPAATRHFEEALKAHSKVERPFDRARTELNFGEALRRSRRRVEARQHLRAALMQFDSLGAHPWTERTSTELRATGETVAARRRRPIETLTPQERQVAGLVAEALTNKEIAQHLFLSPRTVDHHLRSVFGKLGITSRAEIIRMWAQAAKG